MLEEKRIGIKMYMIHDEIDLTHLGYSPDADIIVTTLTECDDSYPKNHQDTGAGVRIEFITNKKKRCEAYRNTQMVEWMLLGKQKRIHQKEKDMKIPLLDITILSINSVYLEPYHVYKTKQKEEGIKSLIYNKKQVGLED